MLKIVLFIVLFNLSVFADVDWTHSIDEAKVKAQKQNKHIILMLSKEGCDACWYMENIVFDDEKVKSLLFSNFVPVYLGIDKDKIPAEYKYVGTPTFYFLDVSGKKLGFRVGGAKNVMDFTNIINRTLEKD